ncbi:MAG: helix-turn-helix domain-containing protein [Pseudanabaena sp.]
MLILYSDRLNLQYLPLIASHQNQTKPNDRVGTKQSAIARLEDADSDGHSLSMLQKIAGALNQKVEIKFSAIAS